MDSGSENKVETSSGWFGNAYLLLTLTTLFWAGNAVAGKLSIDEMSFIALTFYRWALATLIVLPFALRHLVREWNLVRRHAALLFGLGAVGFTGFNLTMYWALHHTSVVNVVIEQAAIPMLIMIINFVAFQLQVRVLQIAGLFMALAGVITTVSSGQPLSLLDNGANLGDAIMMLAALCYAVYSIGLRWRPPIHWLSFVFVLALSACLVSFVFWLGEIQLTGVQWPSQTGWYVVLYVGIFPSLLSQLFYARGVELIGANRAGLFINLVPVFGSLLAVLVLGEGFHWFHGAGLLLVSGGIYLAEHAAKSAKSS